MSLPQRIEAYEDCFEIFEKASTDTIGTRVKFAIYEEAKLYQLRLHTARALQRELSKRLYEPSDPQWGRCEYDKFIVRAPKEDTEGNWWVYIELQATNVLAVEPLSEL